MSHAYRPHLDLFLPIKPGRDVALFNGILHLMIENDWLDHAFIRDYTHSFDEGAVSVRPGHHAALLRSLALPSGPFARGGLVGPGGDELLMHARGIEHHSHGVQNCLGSINIVLALRAPRAEGCGYC